MEKMSLEKEFAENVLLHKQAILREKITRFYIDDVKSKFSGVPLPDCFYRLGCEQQARQDVKELMLRDKETFNRLYEQAWEELKGEIE